MFTTRHFLVAVSSSKERTRKVLVALLLISHFSRLASLVTPTASIPPVDQPRRSDLSVSSLATSTSHPLVSRMFDIRLRSHPFSRFLSVFSQIVPPLQATGFLVLEIFSYRITAEI